MDTSNLGRHISGQFNEEIEALCHKVLTMGGLVEQQLGNALKALRKRDTELARQVLTSDHEINALEVEIDEACTRIIAKRQPAAGDLRLIIAIIKATADLERIGDEAERLAKVATDPFSEQSQGVLMSLENLGNRVLDMLHQVLDAFARMDVEDAYKVHKMDEDIDQQYELTSRLIATYMMEDPRSIQAMMDVSWAARALERIGDRCQNIAEYIIYFVKGKDIRHISRSQIEQDILGQQ